MWLKTTDDGRRTTGSNRVLLLCFMLFSAVPCLFPRTCFAQDAKEDSTNAKFTQQSNANRLAVGMDTTPTLPPDTVLTVKTDTLKRKSLNKFQGHRNGRRFYWNEANYPAGDSSLAAKKLRRHNPLYAALFSAACPGLGQAYNRKYWKIPIVYAGLGGLGYAVYYTASNFYGYRNAYRASVATIPDLNAEYNGVSGPDDLKYFRDYFKKSLDISAICTGVWYLLNIVDATVDAHLFEWNMKDDIHLSWQPVMLNNYAQASSTAPGIQLHLNF